MKPERRLKILILGLNYAPEMVGIAIYTTGLAEALVQRGHDVCAVVGKPYYPSWSVPSTFRGGWVRRGTEAGVDLTRVAHYVPARPTGFRRIMHHASFAVSALLPMVLRASRQKPDVVISIAPSLLAAPIAKLAALLSGARSWLHVQDFEVEAAMATGLVKSDGIFSRFALRFELGVLSMYDRVSSISPAMCHKLGEKGVPDSSIVEFRNWADIDQIRPLKSASAYRVEWAIKTKYVALYSGNIANKQGIEIILAAARHLLHREDLTIVVCGDGPNLKNVKAKAVGLPNMLFYRLQPTERLSELLGLATVHLLPQQATAADLVLPSKLANMLASGRPIITTAQIGTGLATEVSGCGLVVPPGDEVAFANAIERLIDDDAERAALGVRARRRAEERWESKAILDDLERTLISIVD